MSVFYTYNQGEHQMADLGGSATGFRSAFEKYVLKNPHWTKTFKYEVEKKIVNEPYFDARGKILGTCSAGAKLNIIEQRVHNKKFTGDRTAKKYAKVKIGKIACFMKLTAIRKPTGRKNVMEKEQAAINAINEALGKIGYPVDICVKKTKGSGHYTFKNIVKCGNVRGTPKADFTLVNGAGKSVCWVSHKAAGGAKAFQQYSGVSAQAGRNINEHIEVQAFLGNVIALLKEDKLQSPMMKIINDKKLICYAVYGPDYGSNFGDDNCHLIGQGSPHFEQDKKLTDCYHLTWSDGYHTNGDTTFKGGYVPYISAVYKAGRGFPYEGNTYRGARIGIAPMAFTQNRTGLITLT